jgi:hypothetical protein
VALRVLRLPWANDMKLARPRFEKTKASDPVEFKFRGMNLRFAIICRRDTHVLSFCLQRSSGLGAMLFVASRFARYCIGLFYKVVFQLRSAACFAETIVETDLARPRFEQQLLAGTTARFS